MVGENTVWGLVHYDILEVVGFGGESCLWIVELCLDGGQANCRRTYYEGRWIVCRYTRVRGIRMIKLYLDDRKILCKIIVRSMVQCKYSRIWMVKCVIFGWSRFGYIYGSNICMEELVIFEYVMRIFYSASWLGVVVFG